METLLITKLTIKSYLQFILLKNYSVKTLFTIPLDEKKRLLISIKKYSFHWKYIYSKKNQLKNDSVQLN